MGFSYPSHELPRQTCDSERLWVGSAKQPGKTETSRPIKLEKKTLSQQALGKALRKLSFCSLCAHLRTRLQSLLPYLTLKMYIRKNRLDCKFGVHDSGPQLFFGQLNWANTKQLCFVPIVIGSRSVLIAGNGRL